MKKGSPTFRIGPDKWRHLWMGLALALLAPGLTWWAGDRRWPEEAWFIAAVGAALAFVAGLGKELYDHYLKKADKTFDPVDWLFTIAGGLAGSLIVGLTGQWLGTRDDLALVLAFALFGLGIGVVVSMIQKHGL